MKIFPENSSTIIDFTHTLFKAHNRVKTKWNEAWPENKNVTKSRDGRMVCYAFILHSSEFRAAKGHPARLKRNLSHRLWISQSNAKG